MKPTIPKVLSTCAVLLCALQVTAESYSIDWFTFDGGGASTGAGYSLNGMISQFDAGTMSGGGYTLDGGVGSIPPTRAEVLYVATGDNTIEKITPDGAHTLFTNTGLRGPIGLAFDRTGNLYAANINNNTIEKFTPGGVASVFASTGLNVPKGLAFDRAGNLYVSNVGDATILKFTPEGARSVFANPNLSDIYGLAFDASGNLYAAGNNTIKKFTPDGSNTVFATTGLSNPLGLAFDRAGNLYAANAGNNTIQKFTPEGVGSVFASTGLNFPMGLAFDSAGNLYAANYGSSTIEKFTPDGAGSLFVSNGVAGPTFIAFAPESTPSTPAELAADGSTAIPGGTGNFTSLPFAPSLSGSNLVFYGAGSGGQQGIYLMNRGLPVGPTRIADLNTPIPGGAGTFLSFGTEAGIIIVGGDILFSGIGADGQEGIYLSSHATPGALVRIADTATAIPAGSGNFTAFQHAPGFSGSDVAFVGIGVGGQQGIYAVAAIGPPYRIADTATVIPGGSGNFSAFPSGPALSGSEVAFIGNGSDAQQGIYTVAVLAPPQVGPPLRVADNATAIPGGTGNFTAFGSDQAHPVDPAMSADRLAFVGSGSGGQQGIYGASVSVVGPPFKVADTATAIPGGSGNFASFSAVSVSATDLAFLGHGAGGQTGIYDMTGGQLRKVISVGESIQGKMIAGLSFSRAGLFGDPIAFQATFIDGSEGVYSIDVLPLPSELRITAVVTSGTDLRLSIASVTGQNYAVQNRADLSSGAWTSRLGAPTPGTGGTVQITLSNALDQPQQFYRVQVVP